MHKKNRTIQDQKSNILTVNAVAVCGAVDRAVGQQLEVSVLEEHLYVARGAGDVAEVGGALRARLRGRRRRRRARSQRQCREEKPQRARTQVHGAPRPWPPRRRRHCTAEPGAMPPRTTVTHPRTRT